MLNEFLKQHKIIILIPTYDRVGKQKTITNFPKECLGDTVFLVHSKEETHEFPGIICPSEINNIKDKRNYLIDYAQENNYEYLIQIDDDGNFKKFDASGKLNVKLEEQDFVDFITMGLKYDYFSLGNYFFNFGKFGLKENTLGVSFHMFNLKKLGSIRARVFVFEDVDLILQVKDSGGSIATYHDVVFLNSVASKGGNKESENFKNDEIFDRRINELIALHPNRIKKVETKKMFREKYRGYTLRFNLKDIASRKLDWSSFFD
jgi:hypothetical protein